MSNEFYLCGCFVTKNFFSQRLQMHVTFTNRSLFVSEYSEALQHCSGKDVEIILQELEEERNRRLKLGSDSELRRARYQTDYTPLHPQIYTLKHEYLAPEFVQLVEYCRESTATAQGLVERLTAEKASQVYSFPVFTQNFCQLLLEELEYFEKMDLPKGRPNTMNHQGVLLDELGFDNGLLSPLRQTWLQPLTRLLYPDQGGHNLNSHKAFTVHYQMGHDVELNYHYDNAEVTLNVSLGCDFDEGSLYFGPMKDEHVNEPRFVECIHKVGRGIIHRGKHMHGALPITAGQRSNLIVWMRSSDVRNKMCPMCDQPPQLMVAHGFGDGFTRDSVNVCEVS